MLLQIEKLLSDNQLARVQQLLANANFIDGKLSAGKVARQVKHNQELAQDDQLLTQLNNIVMQTLVQHPTFQNAVLPQRIAAPFYAKYGKGQSYGEHIDDPVMGPLGQRYRSDVAVTIFLNPADRYSGGELIIRTQFGEQQVKLNAGDVVLYPASSLHRVAEVTSGERMVAVTWIQSLIRDAAKRELLYELNLAREQLMQEQPQATTTKQIDHSYVNLVRMWSDI